MAHGIVYRQQFENAGAALVAGAAADIAANACAMRAQLAHQPLRQHAEQGRAEQKRFYAHIRQTRDRADRVVGVQSGQYQVSGERGLHRDLRGFVVADFANHDDVRILAQDGAQRLGEVQIDFRIHLGLADTGEFILDRVFHRHDVGMRRVQHLQRRVQGGGFARTCGAGDQHNAVRLLHQVFKLLQGLALHAHGLQGESAFAFVQQTQHRAFAVRTRQRGHAHIDGALAESQGNAAVLRQTFFGDVQVGHDFQTRNQRRMQRPVRADHFAQRAVYAKAHAGVALVGFYVYVAGAVARGLHQQGVEHADDGRVGRGFKQIFHSRQLLHHARQIGFALDLAHHQRRAGFGPGVTGADALRQRGCVGLLEMLHTVAAQHLAPWARRWRVVVPQRQLLAVVFQQQLVAAGKRIRQRMAHVQRPRSSGTGLSCVGGLTGCAGSLLPGSGGSTWSLGTGNAGVPGLSDSVCKPCISR